MISAVVSGNLGKEATINQVGDSQVLEFSVASRRYEKGEEKTDWVKVSFWGQRGSKLQQYLTKGTRVCVRGALGLRTYTHNGQERFEITCRADDIELMGGKSDVATTNGSAVPRDEIPF